MYGLRGESAGARRVRRRAQRRVMVIQWGRGGGQWAGLFGGLCLTAQRFRGSGYFVPRGFSALTHCLYTVEFAWFIFILAIACGWANESQVEGAGLTLSCVA